MKTFNRIAEWVESDVGVILLLCGALALLVWRLHGAGVFA